MKSTTPPTSRRTARIITPATWRWSRGRENKIPVVLASATPSVETEVNARRGRYSGVSLPERFGGQYLPSIEAIDLKTQGPPRGRFIAPQLAEAVQIALETKEQALLFLNRRGYAPLTLCRACGHRMHCPNCDSWLVDHRFKRRLVCHLCGFATPLPPQCPKCQATESFVAGRPGRRAAGAGGGRAFPRRAHARPVERSRRIGRAPAQRARRRRAGPIRYRHRHPAGRQGPSFSQAQPGRHRRCRSRPRQRRSARRRAHLPASASGHGRAGRAEGYGRGLAFKRISPIIR